MQSSSFRFAKTYFAHILSSIDAIHSFVAGLSYTDYCGDIKTKSAVERQLSILSEASIRLRKLQALDLCPGPNWHDACNMGNVLRHQYHEVQDQMIWDTVQDDLPSMKLAVQKTLESDLLDGIN
jgi:uncharacterized protein with HEPN domain